MGEGVTPFSVGGEGPAEIGRDRDSFSAGFGHFLEMELEISAAGVAVGKRNAAILDNHELLIREPAVIAPQGMPESFRPHGGIEEAALSSFDEAVEFMKLFGGKSPVIIEADEVVCALRFLRAQMFGQFASATQIPPIGIRNEPRRAQKAPKQVGLTNCGFERFDFFSGLKGDNFDFRFISENGLGSRFC